MLSGGIIALRKVPARFHIATGFVVALRGRRPGLKQCVGRRHRGRGNDLPQQPNSPQRLATTAVRNRSAARHAFESLRVECWHGSRRPPVKIEMELVAYASGPEVVRELTGYIQHYNGDRCHSSPGYVSPAEFERRVSVPK